MARVTRTRSLWLSEGVTDYFAGAIVRRAGLVSESDARDALGSSIESYLGNPASAFLAPARSSFTDLDLPDAPGLAAVGQLQRAAPDAALIVVSGAEEGLRPQLLAAVSGASAAPSSHRTVPAQRVSEALGWHQPEPSGGALWHRGSNG